MSKLWMLRNYLTHVLNAKRGGHGVHSPFVYKLVEEVFNNQNNFYSFEELNKIRTQLCKDETELEIHDLGAGSQKLHGAKRKIKDIAAHGVSSQKQAEVLFKLISYLKYSTIIELGTSIGLTTLYLSHANAKAHIFTLEGSDSLVNFSNDLFKKHERNNITTIRGNFDDTLPKLLSELKQFDLIYIDGNHTYNATLNYFKMALEKHKDDSVIVFDDIYWSREMTKAWEEIKHHEAVSLSIDCFYFGMVFFRKEQKQKEHFKLLI